MNKESQISELYSMIFNEIPDHKTLESLISIYDELNSIDAVEDKLRNSKKFKILFDDLEKELEDKKKMEV